MAQIYRWTYRIKTPNQLKTYLNQRKASARFSGLSADEFHTVAISEVLRKPTDSAMVPTDNDKTIFKNPMKTPSKIMN